MDSYYGDWFAARYQETRRRLTEAVEPLDETAINWRPQVGSRSIMELVADLAASLQERLRPERDSSVLEREPYWMSKEELLRLIDRCFRRLAELASAYGEQAGSRSDRLELLHECNHLVSERLGQVLYLARMQKAEPAFLYEREKADSA
ncbi:DinB family protein [Gorillibacterium sp. sgz500922]|uniref:DinB family protein n=1 Tax=Gorillibacterium sp. sgz500922 TaxID=3446694 RepID=UPI003F67224F